MLLLGNAGHFRWGERERPSETYTLIKAAGLLPLTAWALRGRELTFRGELELAETIRLWPHHPRRETLAGVVAGLGLTAPLLLSRPLARPAGVPESLLWAAALEPEALLFRLTVSLPLTTVFLEEFVFRGLLQRRFERAWSPGTALLVTSVLFGLWHSASGLQALTALRSVRTRPLAKAMALLAPPLGTIPAGLCFGWLAQRHRTLWAPLIAHWLVAAALIFAARAQAATRRAARAT